jgi:hypothetical protein
MSFLAGLTGNGRPCQQMPTMLSTAILKTFLLTMQCRDYAATALFGNFLHSMQKKTQLQAGTSVDVSMRTMESSRKPDIKKDARLTIRIPRELRDRIGSIDQLYGVALPKIANECLRAFCDYVEQKKQTPTFPLTIGPYLGGEKTPGNGSLRRGRGIQIPHRHQA